MITPKYHDVKLSPLVTIHYVEAGDPTAPTLLLLHGFPTSSFQFRSLIPRLADEYHIIAPDLPGFGHTTVSNVAGTHLTFDLLAATVGELLDHLHIKSFGVYVFDYGAPVGWRLALARPGAVKAVISQNGNAYEEGLSDWWAPLKKWWASGHIEGEVREEVGKVLSLRTVKRQYVQGVPDDRLPLIDPSTWTLDYLHNVAGHEDDQLDLFYDYQINLKIYHKLQQWFRASNVPTLIVWGKNDEIFPGETAGMAFKRDLPNADINMLDGGHFLLETHLSEVAAIMRHFLDGVKW